MLGGVARVNFTIIKNTKTIMLIIRHAQHTIYILLLENGHTTNTHTHTPIDMSINDPPAFPLGPPP